MERNFLGRVADNVQDIAVKSLLIVTESIAHPGVGCTIITDRNQETNEITYKIKRWPKAESK